VLRKGEHTATPTQQQINQWTKPDRWSDARYDRLLTNIGSSWWTKTVRAPARLGPVDQLAARRQRFQVASPIPSDR